LAENHAENFASARGPRHANVRNEITKILKRLTSGLTREVKSDTAVVRLRGVPGLSRIFLRSGSVLAKETVTLAPFTTEKGGAYGHQRNQEMRTSGLYVSGHFGEVLQPAVRDDGRNPGCGLQVPALSLQGQNRIRGPRIVIEDAIIGTDPTTNR
jgi:hypothetical protein